MVWHSIGRRWVGSDTGRSCAFAHGSRRAGAGRVPRSWQCRLGGRRLGRRLEGTRPVEDVLHQLRKVSAEFDHRLLHFEPQRMARQDAEVAVDIGNNSADGPAADCGGNLFGRRQVGESRLLWFGSLGRRGGGRLGRGSGPAWTFSLVQAGGAVEHSRLKRLGEEQAAGDAREDHREKLVLAKTGSAATRWRTVAASSLP